MPHLLFDTSTDPFKKCATCIHNYKASPMWWSCRKEYEGFTYYRGCESREEGGEVETINDEEKS